MDVISLSKNEILVQISRETAKARKKTQKNFKNQFGAKRQKEGKMSQIQQKEQPRMDANGREEDGIFLTTETRRDTEIGGGGFLAYGLWLWFLTSDRTPCSSCLRGEWLVANGRRWTRMDVNGRMDGREPRRRRFCTREKIRKSPKSGVAASLCHHTPKTSLCFAKLSGFCICWRRCSRALSF